MRAYIRLFRPINLVLVALTQYLVLFYIIRPIFLLSHYDLAMTRLDFALFVIAHLMLAAAGYAINDYYDTDIDATNKPEKNMLISRIPRKMGYNINMGLNVVACLIGFYCAYKVGNIKLGFLPVVVALALFYYSLKYKRQFLTGNFAIALIIAYAILVVWLFQFFAIKADALVFVAGIGTYKSITMFVCGMAIFAFLITFIREMVKDMEDVEGDRANGCNTAPVKLGLKKTRNLLMWISIFAMALLATAQYFLFDDYPTTAYYLLVLQIMFVYFLVRLLRAEKKSDYHALSIFLKIMMVAGLLATQMLSVNFLP
ncbi:MAG: geranylgeranylglycerol-phosphate geranylgeranyltransferase [Bacteroidota bacterium]